MPGAVAAVATVLQGFGLPQWLAAGLANIGASVVVSKLQMALADTPSSPDNLREMQAPTELPAWRFAYGLTRVWGTWAPWRVKGDYIYGCLILNSRPSQGIDAIELDNRPVVLEGNLLDMAGPGARAVNDPFDGHFWAWAGLGDQTAPPALFLSEAPELFTAADGWRGLTVLWVKIAAGDGEERAERWPSAPPEIAVDGRWSRVWDPRDPAQSPGDPSTWTWSRNQALIVLDALMRNPVRQYGLTSVNLGQFITAAGVADGAVPLKAGGSEPAYRADGVLVFSGDELLDQVIPLFDAGASRPTRTGGRVGIVPGCWRDPVATIGDVLDERGMEFARWRPVAERPTLIRTLHVNPQRGYEWAELADRLVPAPDGEPVASENVQEMKLTFVVSPTQAQRLQQIAARRAVAERSWTGIVPAGDALNAVAGSVVTLALPSPYGRMNGTYDVESIHPGFDPAAKEGAALRLPIALREDSPWVWEWNPATDERPVLSVPFDGTRKKLSGKIVSITPFTGPAEVINTGESRVASIRYLIQVEGEGNYAWEWRPNGSGSWQPGGSIRIAGSGSVRLAPVTVGDDYDFRIHRIVGLRHSENVEVLDVRAIGPEIILPPPTNGAAVTSGGKVDVTFRLPNKPDVRGIQFMVGTSPDPAAAVQMGTVIAAAAWTDVTARDSGLTVGSARYYWARTVGTFNATSGLSGRVDVIVK